MGIRQIEKQNSFTSSGLKCLKHYGTASLPYNFKVPDNYFLYVCNPIIHLCKKKKKGGGGREE
jgi:hypothetical protein